MLIFSTPLSFARALPTIAGWWLCLALAVACSPVPPSPTATPLPATDRVVITPASATPPASTAINTANPTSSRTPPPSLRTTATFVPIRTDAEEQAFAFSNLRTNGGCRLPCWWGITPGLTDLQTVVSLFNGATAQGSAYFQAEDVAIGASATWNHVDWTHPFAAVPAFIVKYCYSVGTSDCYGRNPFYSEPLYPSLPFLLATYGQPDHVLANFDIGLREMGFGSDLFFLWLDYSSQGWHVVYTMVIDSTQPLLLPCLDHATATLTAWNAADHELSQSYRFSAESSPPLEDVVNLSEAEFFNLYQQPTQPPCLTVPNPSFNP